MWNGCGKRAGTMLANDTLKQFYNYLAFGEFDKALEYVEQHLPDIEKQENVIVQALKVKKLVKNYTCHNSF